MWVLLLLGLLPLAILPSMLDGGSGGDGADDDDSDNNHDGSGSSGSGADGHGWMTDTGSDSVLTVPDEEPEMPPDNSDDGEGGGEPPVEGSPEFVATTFDLVPGDGVAAFADFVPGEDRLEIHVDPDGPEPEMTSGIGEDGAWVRVTQGDALAEARFPGLTEPPLSDIHLVSGVLDPDLSDDAPSDTPEPDDADEAVPLLPVTDDVDEPGGADADDDTPVLSPVVPPEGGT